MFVQSLDVGFVVSFDVMCLSGRSLGNLGGPKRSYLNKSGSCTSQIFSFFHKLGLLVVFFHKLGLLVVFFTKLGLIKVLM